MRLPSLPFDIHIPSLEAALADPCKVKVVLGSLVAILISKSSYLAIPTVPCAVSLEVSILERSFYNVEQSG